MKPRIPPVLFRSSVLILGLGTPWAFADWNVSGIPGASTTGETTTATFDMSIDSSLDANGPFATEDTLTATGNIVPAPADVGATADLYVVALANGYWFNRDSGGTWHRWDRTLQSLIPATAPITLQNPESLPIVNDFQMRGDFSVFMGYGRSGQEPVIYNSRPVSVVVNDLVFAPISVPATVEEKRQIRASEAIAFEGTTRPIGYRTLVRTNQQLDRLGGAAGETEIFGLLKKADGSTYLEQGGSPWVCTNGSGPDHTSFLTFEDDLFAVTQLECSLGGAYVTQLDQDAEGNLSAVSTRSVDFSGVFGTYVNCAGMTTPWNTHLGSEEYEPPMGIFDASAENAAWFDDPTWHDEHMQAIADYNGLQNTAENAAYFGYYYGWIPEIALTSANGDTQVQKHFAMGRFAHELAYVMPDERTVYLSDDGTNVALFMFIADQARDLSAGTLYAARWNQVSDAGVGSATIDWINLGHATDAEVRAALEARTTFDDMFEKADPLDAETGTCPEGFTSTNTYDVGLLCTGLKDGMEQTASRLETRLYAAHRGATTEFRKEEGLTFNADDGILYVAMSEVRKGMEDGSSSDVGGPNHIRVAANSCGEVYGMDVMPNMGDTDGDTIASQYVVGNMYGVVAGTPKDYTGTEFAGNTCDLEGIASPDNVSYLPHYGILLIGEDTSSHQNDMVWAYDVRSKRLDRIATTPYGSEATSPFWHRNINGFGYVTLVTQHPYGESDEDLAEDDSDKESYVGYIGPFPALD